MKEEPLRRTLRKLGVEVSGVNRQRSTGKIWLNFPCPIAEHSEHHKFRADRNPSAGAVVDDSHASRWFCFACKQHGTILELAQSLKELEDDPKVPYDVICEEVIDLESESLANIEFGEDLHLDPLPEPLIEEAYEGIWPNAWDCVEARNYLEQRGISEEAATKMGLLFETEQARILFPVRDRQGNLYGWSGRAVRSSTRPKILDMEGLPKRHMVLGAERWVDGKPLIIVEGLFAYAHLISIGVEDYANIGALLGSVMTFEKAQVIGAFGAPTYLLTDPDEAGDACIFGAIKDGERMEETSAIHLLRPHVPVFLPAYPEGVSDPDDLTLSQVVEFLKNTPPYGIDPLPDLGIE